MKLIFVRVFMDFLIFLTLLADEDEEQKYGSLCNSCFDAVDVS
jgi:hypothetical protein